jgi:hypothetical protein
VSTEQRTRRADGVLASGAVLMILCCAVGPAVLGAAAGSVIGGWVGIACAVVVAGAFGLVVHRRRSPRRC